MTLGNVPGAAIAFIGVDGTGLVASAIIWSGSQGVGGDERGKPYTVNDEVAHDRGAGAERLLQESLELSHNEAGLRALRGVFHDIGF